MMLHLFFSVDTIPLKSVRNDFFRALTGVTDCLGAHSRLIFFLKAKN